METIKNYLENMFMHLPNTEEVRKAKDELAQMMEDKYNELISEGKTENEAVGTVIAEFGNLNELAEALGIDNVMNPKQNGNTKEFTENYTIQRRVVPMDQAIDYLRDNSRNAFRLGLGIMLAILCVVGPILADAFKINQAIGVACMFVLIAVAVVIFISVGTASGKWDFLKKEPCAIDFATFKAVKSEEEQNTNNLMVFRSIGIVLCILCFVPAAVLDEINIKIPGVSFDDIGGAILFVFVAIGVFLIVYSQKQINGYKLLSGLNDSNTVAGSYNNEYNNQYNAGGKAPKGFLQEIYWPTITCIYLSWSFLTYDWHITWIVWPIAAVASPLINLMFKE